MTLPAPTRAVGPSLPPNDRAAEKMSKKSPPVHIQPEQLCVGIYVHLDLGWLDHSFPLNSFKISSLAQIAAIRQLGLKKIRVNPARSDCRPLPLPAAGMSPVATAAALPSAEDLRVIEAKRARIERLVDLHATAARCEKQLLKAAGTLKNINRNIFSRPQEALKEASELVQHMLDSLLIDKDIAIHLMNDKVSGEELYHHALNVAVLAMMLGRELGLPAGDIRHLGTGCLFHDIGKVEIPDRIVLKTQALTRAEQNILHQHCHYGEAIGKKIGLPREVLDIIVQHHEYADGSGYPSGLRGDQVSVLASIVSIVNSYDNLCNQPNPNDSLSPFEALSCMFAQQARLFSAGPLNVFIRCLGVYPPGTIVSLSNGMQGMVVSVNSDKPLRPGILVYDPDVPKGEAIILDLAHEVDIHVSSSLKPKQLAPEVYEYLSPRKRMNYFFDAPKTHAAPRK